MDGDCGLATNLLKPSTNNIRALESRFIAPPADPVE
jgi:hypothetical protein